MSKDIKTYIADHMAALPHDQQRFLTPTRLLPGGRLMRGGKEYIDFSSNDYLGLAHHPDITKRAAEWAKEYGNGSGASRLVSGDTPLFEKLETKIARMKGSESALVMGSGFQANASVLSTLLDLKLKPGLEPLLFTDKLNHASLHSGARMAGTKQIRFRHNDLDHLETLLEKHKAAKRPSFIVTESVFSMDGDILDIDRISTLSKKYNSFLYIDEAHATGVLGGDGAGLCKGDQAQLIMGTCGKALGSYGAYIACSQQIKDYLINTCPGFIYATALPPSILGAIDAALDLLPELEHERSTLQINSKLVREHLTQIGFDCSSSQTQIIPALIGSNSDVLRAGEILEDNGIICGIIRPPTVPPNTARVRICLSAAHSDAHISKLLDVMDVVKSEIKT